MAERPVCHGDAWPSSLIGSTRWGKPISSAALPSQRPSAPPGRSQEASTQSAPFGHIVTPMPEFPRKSAVFPRVRIPASRPHKHLQKTNLPKANPRRFRTFREIARQSRFSSCWLCWTRAPRPAPVIRSSIQTPEKQFVSFLALSPDGTRLVFSTNAVGAPPRLWVRRLDGVRSEPIPGTEEATFPFWSPDGQFLAFTGGLDTGRDGGC
jgi:hypothetical protein